MTAPPRTDPRRTTARPFALLVLALALLAGCTDAADTTRDDGAATPADTTAPAADPAIGRLVEIALLDYSADEAPYAEGRAGPRRGCDRVVFVRRDVEADGAPLTAALEELFAIEQDTVDGLDHFLATTRETLSFERAAVEQGLARVYLQGRLSGLGGTCDGPRARIQIEETALRFPTVDSVALFLDGRPTDLRPDARGRP